MSRQAKKRKREESRVEESTNWVYTVSLEYEKSLIVGDMMDNCYQVGGLFEDAYGDEVNDVWEEFKNNNECHDVKVPSGSEHFF